MRDWKEEYKEEWEKIGIYYDRDDEKGIWHIHGSADGLLFFAELLKDYTGYTNRQEISEHEHYGPYQYLKVVTWNEPKIIRDGIYGRMEDIFRLAEIIERGVEKGVSPFTIDSEYSDANENILEIYIEDEDFDPASLDTALWE